MRKLLWIGDAACQSGFAKATHFTLDVLRERFEVAVLGLNYRGDPHDYPYNIFPAAVSGDVFGINRLEDVMHRFPAEIVVIQNDPWNLPRYMKRFNNQWPVIAALAVDGKNCRGRALNGLTLAIFWTQFALDEARAGGYTGPAAVVPLGVDLALFKPQSRHEARALLGLPPKIRNAFVVGNVNRNQPRKRLDLTIAYFAEWIRTRKIDDAYLFLHVAPTGDQGYDCQQLAGYYGVANRLILVEPEVFHGVEETAMPRIYNSFDVMFTTTQGEGWGLPAMEGMACGIPQIVPDWAALGEWTGDAALKIPCSEICVTPNFINSVGAVPDRAPAIEALDLLYRSHEERERLRQKGFELVRRPEYNWREIGERFADAVEQALELPTVKRTEKVFA